MFEAAGLELIIKGLRRSKTKLSYPKISNSLVRRKSSYKYFMDMDERSKGQKQQGLVLMLHCHKFFEELQELGAAYELLHLA